MVIPIKPIKQPNSNACSITCMRMILEYYGLKVSNDEVFDFIIKVTPEENSFLSEIGRFARSKGFWVGLYAYNLYLTDPSDADLPKSEFLKKLKKELKDPRKNKYYELMAESTINAVKEGVEYIIKKPSFEIIKTNLEKKIPLSVRINYTALANEQGNPFISHDVVLAGLKGKSIYVIDPWDASGKWFRAEDLLFSIFQSRIISVSGYLLAVKK